MLPANKVYLLASRSKDGSLSWCCSGRGFGTPFAVENIGSARGEATRRAKRSPSYKGCEFVIFEVDQASGTVKEIETKKAACVIADAVTPVMRACEH